MSNGRSTTSGRPPHVLVIGGGIGGLCLAQGLKKSGISVAVYERDRSVRFRGQGYRISIKEQGGSALRDCLPENLSQLCIATSIKTATRMAFLDHQLNQAFAKPLPPAEPTGTSFGVNRLTLREILLAGLDDIVHFGSTFRRLDQVGDGQVRAWFADGTSATGDLLVGADGTDSVVRGQVVPDAKLDGLGSFIYGRTPIRSGTLSWVPEILVDSFNRINGPGGVGMSVATCRKRASLSAATARLAPGVRLTETPDYLAWMLSGGPVAAPSGAAALAPGRDGAALHRLARGLLEGWHPALQRIVDEADVPATFLVDLRSARPVRRWHTTNVTLMGDAIHTMSPGRGEGANTALRDAQLLRRKLVEVAANRVMLAQAKAEYETAMLGYGFEAVADSLGKPFIPRARPGSRPPA
jgi:2-polyprenyl-6-methoxyphenol hydroxylase-like FAD-dependent oxidoreductase